MTNAEKFEEVFKIQPALNSSPVSCTGVPCKRCSYYNGNCNARNWWAEEYKKQIKPDFYDSCHT